MSVYYLGNETLKIAFKNWCRKNRQRTKKACDIAREYGELVSQAECAISGRFILGFNFKKAPDEKLWVCESKNWGTYWRPRLSSKEGKKIKERLEPYLDIPTRELENICGLKGPIFMGDRVFYGPGLELIKDKIIVSYPEAAIGHKQCKIPEDFTELAFSQYQALKGKAKKK